MASKKSNYYTIKFEKFIEVLEDTEKIYLILCDRIKTKTSEINETSWSSSEIPDIFEFYIIINSFRDFLDAKINNPSDEEIEFCMKNNIKDVLFTKSELQDMQNFFLAIEARKYALNQIFNFNFSLN